MNPRSHIARANALAQRLAAVQDTYDRFGQYSMPDASRKEWLDLIQDLKNRIGNAHAISQRHAQHPKRKRHATRLTKEQRAAQRDWAIANRHATAGNKMLDAQYRSTLRRNK